jgi:ABC-type glycerol-3-phosphate transport system substrate-binding protein
MRKVLLVVLVLTGCLSLASSTWAELLPGKTVEERCINGAKAYVKKHKLENPVLNALQISLFRNAHPKYDQEWEKLTGIKMKAVVYGYTDIPSKIMAEAVAKTGQWDVFMQFPRVVPDASGAGVLQPLGEYATSLLAIQGNYECWNVLDKNLTLVMQGNLTAEEAARRTEAGWNQITEDIGRKEQIEAWRAGVAMGAYIDTY